ncbi:TonB-dependent receptor [Sphingomonas hengshuiensis]|nr:TonB-dependent receptor [Sphingomonas hengshuiensis]
MTYLLTGAAAPAILLATALPAYAQDAAPAADVTDDSEIVVTALKTGAQQLDKVPVAIQAFSQETLGNRGVRDAADLMQLIPGASQAQEIGAGYRIFSFRGSGAGGAVGDGMIGYYLDDTPFGVPNNQSAPPLQFFDIEQVEVLRGPQGTLYGQGSMGGTIIYRTKNPSLDRITTSGDFELSNTRDSGKLNYRAAGAVSVPLITDKLGIRLSGGYEKRAGYNDIYSGAPVGEPYKTDANNIISKDLQAVILWKPTDRATVRLRAWHFSTDQDYLNVMNSVNPPYAAYQGTIDGYDKRSANYYSGTFTYEFDKLTLTNATSYQDSKPGGFGLALNLGEPLGIGLLVNGGHANNFVNELRLTTSDGGPLHWVGGLFYQKANGYYTFKLDFPTLKSEGETITRTENASIFSEVSYELFDGKLVPLLGLRYVRDKRSSESVSNGVPATSEAEPDALTWRANLAYYATDDWMFFFNAGTGFRSGILQSQAQADAVTADGVPSSLSLTPDKLRNLEIGVKGSFADGKVRVATSVYDIKYTNLQAAFTTSIGLSAFANLGDATTQGVDIELAWDTPLKGLTLSSVANFNTSEFTNVKSAFAGADPRVANGQELYNTPPFNVRFDASFDRKVGEIGVFANASATAVGRARNGDATVDTLDPYELYRASAGIRIDNYEFRIFGENLSDYRGPTSANGPTLLAGPRPLTVGVGLRVNY